MMQRIKAMVFSLVVIAVGAGVVMAGTVMGGETREVRGWPKVEGKLLHADTKRENTADGERVAPDVKYEYIVAGQTYTSTTFEPGFRNYKSRSEITREVNPFKAGASVTVYYNEARPAEAYLSARPRGGFVVIAGYGVGALGILMFVLSALGVVKVTTPDTAQ